MKVHQTVWSLLVFLVLTSDENGCRIASTTKSRKCFWFTLIDFSTKRLVCLTSTRPHKLVSFDILSCINKGCMYVLMVENSLRIALAFRWVQFERVFKYREYCKPLIAKAFIRLLIIKLRKFQTRPHCSCANCKLAIKLPALSQWEWKNFLCRTY